MAKTQIRSRIESRERAAREEDRAAQRLHRSASAPARAPAQTTSRRKEVERLQTTELARSNIQRPYIRFTQNRPSGKVAVEFKGLSEGVRRSRGDRRLQRHRQPRREDRARRPQRRRQDHAAQGAAGGHARPAGRRPAISTRARCAGATRCRSATSRRTTPARSNKGMTAVEWLHRFDPDASPPGHPRPARADALQRRGRAQAHRGAVGRRDRAAALLPHHAAEAERARSSTSRPTTSTSSRSTRSTSRCRSTRARCCWSPTTRTCSRKSAPACGTSSTAGSPTSRAPTRSTRRRSWRDDPSDARRRHHRRRPGRPGVRHRGRREGLRPLVIDKGALVNSIVGYPGATWSSSRRPELIEIGGYPVSGPGLQADARGGDRVLPRRGRSARRSTSGSTNACSSVRGEPGRLHGRDRQGRAPGAPRRRLDRLLRSAEPAGRARRGSAEGHALLPRAVSATSGRRSP